jgi:hypothetical protein
MNLEDDRQFEQHLRSFRPSQPAPLEVPPRRGVPDLVKVTFASAAVLAVLVAFLPKAGERSKRETTSSGTPAITVRQLTLASQNGELDHALAASAQRSLPRTDQPHTALNTLAKD